jgi:hypothetical protein
MVCPAEPTLPQVTLMAVPSSSMFQNFFVFSSL